MGIIGNKNVPHQQSKKKTIKWVPTHFVGFLICFMAKHEQGGRVNFDLVPDFGILSNNNMLCGLEQFLGRRNLKHEISSTLKIFLLTCLLHCGVFLSSLDDYSRRVDIASLKSSFLFIYFYWKHFCRRFVVI